MQREPPISTLFPYTTLFRSSIRSATSAGVLADLAARSAATDVASPPAADRKSTRLNSSHRCISYAVFCLKKKTSFAGMVDAGFANQQELTIMQLDNLYEIAA